MDHHTRPVAWFAWSDINRVGNLGQYIDLHTGFTAPDAVTQSDRTKLVFVNWWQEQTQPGFQGLDDLSWADLVVCITSEIVPHYCHGSWEQFLRRTRQRFNNDNCVFVAGGRRSDCQDPRIFSNYRFFFLEVLRANQVSFELEIDSQHRPYLFDLLLGKHKVERAVLLKWMHLQGLAPHCLINMHANPFDPASRYHERTPALDQLEGPYGSAVWAEQSPDHVPDCCSSIQSPTLDGWPVWASCLIAPDIYRASWYSIVAETQFNQSTEGWRYLDFLTEKTAKALYGGRVFVLLAAPGSLAQLHALGFETFGDVIDESYDQIHNDRRRMQAVQQQIQQLSEQDPQAVYERCRARLEHNHRHFASLVDQKALCDFLQGHIVRTIPK